MKSIRVFCSFIILFGCLSTTHGQSFLKSLTEEEVTEIKSAIESMKRDTRGPYLRIRWFCADGTLHPPRGNPCADRGGGVQHAEFNGKAKRLAELHFNVGTILQSLNFEEFFNAPKDNYRLKEFILAKYLVETDDGWVLRQAQYYRGARQIEDEEKQGLEFLQKMLANPTWTSRNFLLASQLVGAVPHSTAEQSSHKIRNLASAVAELDADFMQLRIRIHSFPSHHDLEAVEAYLSAKNLPRNVREKLAALRDELRQQYDSASIIGRLDWYEKQLGSVFEKDLVALGTSLQQGDLRTSFSQIAAAGVKLREQVTRSSNGKANLVMMDLIQLLQEKAFVLAQELELENSQLISRIKRLRSLSDCFALAFSAGLLSRREREALEAEISRLVQNSSLSALEYRQSIGYLTRSLDWGRTSTRELFDVVYQHYYQVEPKVSGFLDSLLRGSVLLPLSLELDRVSRDADNLLGQSHFILGRRVSQGTRGLNPGVAMTILEILEDHQYDWHPDPTKIYVIPETVPELRPLAGILTLDAGNLLSHAQLLARNLGIPNASISSLLLPDLRAFQGKEVFYAVSPLGVVLLKESSQLTELEKQLLEYGRDLKARKVKLDTSRLRLDQVSPIPLEQLGTDSGAVVGPKAAKLGQLAALFPGHVPPGVALPFGMYYRLVNRKFDSEKTLFEEIQDAYRRAAEMRTADKTETEIDAFMFRELARFREAIVNLEWIPETRHSIVQAIGKAFGADLSKGLFVRSDTNVEDLPQFSGAGLNLTVPHVRTVEDVLSSIKRVWASPFSERAYLWRKQVLDEQGQIYPSVLLLQSVPSEKSGVVITSGLEMGKPDDLTIVTAEGVGGAVEGENAETLLVEKTGEVKLLSQAKSAYQKVLVNNGAGGITLVPSRKTDYLLTPDDIGQLQRIVAEWKQRIPASQRSWVWDIEFGFSGGKLWLFQIRPFVRHRNRQLLERLQVLDQEVLRQGTREISLEEQI
ncbi:hypothetical protein MYX84_02985 [Acidobacteria bacterium AH-259-O06]|nr:hypothetical protein [Acidobacteria bacterium AH-259-O06]